MPTTYLLIIADLIAIAIVSVIYFHRHRRRDLLTAFIAVNIGVLAVTVALAGAAASLGLGLGLFGVLSIIRLRSTELGQHEIAYYFAALALGLLGGLAIDVSLTLVLMALVALAVLAADSPVLLGRYRQQTMILDRAISSEAALIDHVELLLGATVVGVVVQRLDYVNDSTTVDIRYRLPLRRTQPSQATMVDAPSPELISSLR